MITPKYFLFYLSLCQIIQLVRSGFHPADRLQKQSLDGVTIQSLDIDIWGNSLVDLGSREMVYVYTDQSDDNPYMALIRNGVGQNSFRIFANVTEGGLNVCKVDTDKFMTVFNHRLATGYLDVQAQIMDVGGNLIGGVIEDIDGDTGTTNSLHGDSCQLIDGTSRVAITYSLYDGSNMWDVYYNEIDLVTRAIINNVPVTSIPQRQYGSTMTQLKGPNSHLIMVYYHQEETFTTLTQAIDITTNTTVSDGQLEHPFITGHVRQILPLSTGGYFLLAANAEYLVYDETHTEICRGSLPIQKPHGTITPGDIVYITGHSGVQELLGYSIETISPSQKKGNLLYRNVDNNQVQWPLITYSENSHTSLLSIVFYLENSVKRHVILEYLEKNLLACPRNQCFGCIDGNDICPVCSGATELERLIRSSDDGNCMCRKGYYHDPVFSECQRCRPECETCANGNQCLTCSAIYSKPPSCSCVYYPQQSPQFEIHQYQFDGIPGYKTIDYIDSISIDQCKEECLKDSSCMSFEYYVGGDKCILQNSVTVLNSLKGGRGQGMEKVDDFVNYYVKTTTMVPKCSCDYQCGECIQEPNFCHTCSHETRILPDCKCRPNFYDDGNSNPECVQCNSKCLLCGEDQNTCIQCIDSDRDSPSCQCRDGLYEDLQSKKCLQCPQQCQKCSSQNQCTECVNSSFSPPLCLNQVKNSMIIGSQNSDIQCNKQCDRCTKSIDNCLKCQEGINRSLELPLCSCKDGYHDHGGTQQDCFKCPPTCELCSNQLQCTKCKDDQNREIDLITNQCVCKKGYRQLYQNSLVCEKCYNYQNECLTSCPPNTQKDDKYGACIYYKEQHLENKVTFIIIGLVILSMLIISLYLIPKKVYNKEKFEQKQNHFNSYNKNSSNNNQALSK